MDFLKGEILKKRKERQQKQCSNSHSSHKKYKTNKEIFEEKAKAAEEERRNKKHNQTMKASREDLFPMTVNMNTKREDDSKHIQDLYLPRKEIFKRLRLRSQPLLVFGETLFEASLRLQHLETDKPMEYLKEDENVVLKALRKQEAVDAAPDGETKQENPLFSEFEAPDNDHKNNEIINFFIILVRKWNEQLNTRLESEKKSQQGKLATAYFCQFKVQIEPLFLYLKENTLPNDILIPLYNITTALKQREYIKANDIYLQMAIGNAPWPMGVTMVGIHERKGREKISTSQLPHILNDETQRKYLQSVKRLMTVCQNLFPNDPSKCIG